MIKRILVATDGSSHASSALDAAADIAKACNAEVTVAHVMRRAGSGRVPEELRSLAELEHIEITEQQMLQSVGEEIARNAAQRLRAAGVTRVNTRVEVGSPADKIVAIAHDINADLIAIGRRGLGGLGSTLLGSVSLKVMQTADVPCLTVK
jgi:nucleotide-binding universal stress UspA family protein